jgi:hypothetical protein
MQIASQPVRVQGRVLPAPTLVFADKQVKQNSYPPVQCLMHGVGFAN